MSDAIHPLSAASAEDPYPFYAHLVATRPFYRDEALDAWIASSAAAVEAVLGDDALRVRPPNEPVPASLAGSQLGRVFAHLARMTDGAAHAATRHALLAALWGVSRADVVAAVARCAPLLVPEGAIDAATLDRYLFALPVAVVAVLLDLDDDGLAETIAAASAFVAAIAPGATSSAIARGELAVERLKHALGERIARAKTGSVLATLAERIDEAHLPRESAVANAIGLLFQSHDAVAGLIGNTLRARPPMDAPLDAFVTEVARSDAPVHNTRRFAARDVTIAGSLVRRGETVLAVLAAANLDPARTQPCYTFGLGAHACPGTRIATLIAAEGVARLLARIDRDTLEAASFRPATNVRIPVFTPHPLQQTNIA